MGNNTKTLNLVYDKWDDDTKKPIPNGSWDASNLIHHFIKDTFVYNKFELKNFMHMAAPPPPLLDVQRFKIFKRDK